MAYVSGSKNSFSVKAYIGDNKTLLAFNFASPEGAKNLAGFSIRCQPPGVAAYYLLNELRFEDPTKHAQVAAEKPNSSVNAPIQKYRWVHVLGMAHQGLSPALGKYTYTVTPRYFDANHSMQPLDGSLSATLTVPVGPFKKGALSLGFTRGYMQSEAFAHHFGLNARLTPAGKPLLYDTSQQAGSSNGQNFTFADEYAWMGWTARQQVFSILNTVLNDTSLTLDVFAYDLNEPDVCNILLKLAEGGRLRMILDNASLHVTQTKGGNTAASSEDQFTTLFKQKAKAPAAILRGCFARYSHDKIFIVSKGGKPTQVLTGSTNFSVTGLYVNANHVLVFNDGNVAAQYAKVFEESWQVLSKFKTPSTAAANAFSSGTLATQPYTYQSASIPKLSITFSPHTTADVDKILSGISDRIKQETSAKRGNVLFAVMQLTGSQSPVYSTLSNLHTNQSVFSYGISDSPAGTYLYAPGTKTGVMVTGKPGKTTLPPPFDQVPTPPGHEIHDKFVICGLNGSDPVVYCGSSNLATGGEAANGDNLLEIHDADVATAFAIEALLLVDHYNFLDRMANPKAAKPSAAKGSPATKPAARKPPTTTATRKRTVKAAAKTTTTMKRTPVKKSQAKKTTKKKGAARAARA
jgi:hypothetical protein